MRKQYEPDDADIAFEAWWYGVYTNKPRLIERQCFSYGYEAGVKKCVRDGVIAVATVVVISLLVVLFGR